MDNNDVYLRRKNKKIGKAIVLIYFIGIFVFFIAIFNYSGSDNSTKADNPIDNNENRTIESMEVADSIENDEIIEASEVIVEAEKNVENKDINSRTKDFINNALGEKRDLYDLVLAYADLYKTDEEFAESIHGTNSDEDRENPLLLVGSEVNIEGIIFTEMNHYVYEDFVITDFPITEDIPHYERVLKELAPWGTVINRARHITAYYGKDYRFFINKPRTKSIMKYLTRYANFTIDLDLPEEQSIALGDVIFAKGTIEYISVHNNEASVRINIIEYEINPESALEHIEFSENVADSEILTTSKYIGEEGLIAYYDLKQKGYSVEAEFENPTLTKINGKASDLFEMIDPNNEDDRLSVDAFVVVNVEQNGDSILLTLILQPVYYD